jgi:hypothetical protein
LIEINGAKFVPNPECRYRNDYVAIAQKIAEGYVDPEGNKWDELSVYRTLILTDLWFVLYFVVKPWASDAGREMVNRPFVVASCREIEDGPKDFTLDVWARFHYKSAIITCAENIQHALRNSNESIGIFSSVAPTAKKFLFSIKSVFENDRMLKACFPDVVWQDCAKEAPMWSIDGGLVLKRTTNRKEPTIGAYGLTEGMPVGLHFERMVYDDITNEDIGRSLDVMADVKQKFDSSRNLKSIVGSSHRVVGTYYHHSDPLVYIRDKKRIDASGQKRPTYLLRLKPATDTGKIDGKPVLMDVDGLEDMKGEPGSPAAHTFNCQQLLNPTPEGDRKLNPDYLNRIEHRLIPKNVYRFMIIDQAGDEETNKNKGSTEADSWAVESWAVEPSMDALGQSRVFLENAWIQPAGETEAIEQIVRMYCEGGVISKLGVEKVGLSTTHIHIANALRARGRHVTFEDSGNSVGVLLRPAGRNKKKFILGALEWPLNNGKIFISSNVPNAYVERLRMEMENFPLWHDDALNGAAYFYDVLKDFYFSAQDDAEEGDESNNVLHFPQRHGISSVGGY